MTSTPSQPAESAALTAAVDLARSAAQVEAGDEPVGEYVGGHTEDDAAVTHLFDAAKPGYRGWRWAVTVAGAGADVEDVTVSEVVLLPGPDALTAPTWVPWHERVQAGDLGVGDLMPAAPDDPRLAPGYLESDDPAVEEVAMEVGLGRERVLSREGRLEAARRWHDSEFGPRSDMARSAPAHCGTCGFYVAVGGSLRAAFGVCSNDISPADGHVVHAEYGCGAHSETEVEQVSPVLVADLIYDDATLDVEPGAPAAEPAAGGEAANGDVEPESPAEQPVPTAASAVAEPVEARAEAADAAVTERPADAPAVESLAAEPAAASAVADQSTAVEQAPRSQPDESPEPVAAQADQVFPDTTAEAPVAGPDAAAAQPTAADGSDSAPSTGRTEAAEPAVERDVVTGAETPAPEPDGAAEDVASPVEAADQAASSSVAEPEATTAPATPAQSSWDNPPEQPTESPAAPASEPAAQRFSPVSGPTPASAAGSEAAGEPAAVESAGSVEPAPGSVAGSRVAAEAAAVVSVESAEQPAPGSGVGLEPAVVESGESEQRGSGLVAGSEAAAVVSVESVEQPAPGPEVAAEPVTVESGDAAEVSAPGWRAAETRPEAGPAGRSPLSGESAGQPAPSWGDLAEPPTAAEPPVVESVQRPSPRQGWAPASAAGPDLADEPANAGPGDAGSGDAADEVAPSSGATQPEAGSVADSELPGAPAEQPAPLWGAGLASPVAGADEVAERSGAVPGGSAEQSAPLWGAASPVAGVDEVAERSGAVPGELAEQSGADLPAAEADAESLPAGPLAEQPAPGSAAGESDVDSAPGKDEQGGAHERPAYGWNAQRPTTEADADDPAAAGGDEAGSAQR